MRHRYEIYCRADTPGRYNRVNFGSDAYPVDAEAALRAYLNLVTLARPSEPFLVRDLDTDTIQRFVVKPQPTILPED